MLDWLTQFLAVRGLAPHGYCLLWDPALIWSHVLADALIALAYFSIPFTLWRLLRLRRDLQFGWMIALFATFILACGMTHAMGIVTLWVPAYGWEALVKLFTAAVSVATAVLFIPLLGRLVALPSRAELQVANDALLAEAAERERTEAMLRQAQKMEAIGLLTGGVAHDFNNLLAVIIGSLDRVKRRGEAGPEVLRALAGAERAARLTDQLLSFARKQPLKREPHDLNRIVGQARELIAQSVGPEIALRFELAPALPAVVLDPNQMENALLNLAINARDAIDGAGTLTIATRRADGDPGLVELAVSDTGSGMDARTLERAADPFFTTKPVGRGSGLGLSQVYGMVQQLGGRVEIDSQPGTGTAVRLFLPVQRGQ